jgi:hypothetical protein
MGRERGREEIPFGARARLDAKLAYGQDNFNVRLAYALAPRPTPCPIDEQATRIHLAENSTAKSV